MSEKLLKNNNAIEEMAKVLIDYTKKNHISASTAILTDYAEQLYNANYRKQSEGEWISELRERCDWRGKKQQYYQPNSCSVCHEAVVERTPFCPNCGAKMKAVRNESLYSFYRER